MKIAVIGATTNTAREILSLMAERDIPVKDVVALDDREALGREISYGEDDVLKVDVVDDYDFKGVTIAVFATLAPVAGRFAPKAAKAGAIVIDTSSEFALEPDVPLIIADVNDDNGAFLLKAKRNIIASPAASVLQLISALKPLADAFGLKRATVTAMIATSAVGKEAMDELFDQTRGVYMNMAVEDTKKEFSKQIAFNLIPFLDAFMADGQLREESAIAAEGEKLLGAGTKITANCVVAPTFIGSAQYVNVETKKEIEPENVRAVLAKAEGITVFDHHKEEGFATPAEIAGEDNIFISRVRKDFSVANGFSFFSVVDVVRVSALNAVKLIEIIANKKG